LIKNPPVGSLKHLRMSVMQNLDHLKWIRSARGADRRTLWLHTDGEEIDFVYPIVDLALRERQAIKLIVAAPARDVPELRRRFPFEHIEVSCLTRDGIAKSDGADGGLLLLGRQYRDVVVPCANVIYVDDSFGVGTLLEALPVSTEFASKSGESTVFRFLLRVVAGRAVRSIGELRERLGKPSHILCLGNGPSSEDPRLSSISWDCLFRVNWIWQSRGILVNPSVVFTADLDLPCGDPRPIVILPNETAGMPVLRNHCFRLRPPRQGYGFADRLLSPSWERPGKAMPSNGALMIGVAAALAPDRITISGMDLYSHPEGRYPGDPVAVDGYSRDHSRITDLEFISEALGSYHGVLAILSDALSDGLGRRNARP
jgi:hypothetical protein